MTNDRIANVSALKFDKKEIIAPVLTVHSNLGIGDNAPSDIVTFRDKQGREVGIRVDDAGKLIFVYSNCDENNGADVVISSCKTILSVPELTPC